MRIKIFRQRRRWYFSKELKIAWSTFVQYAGKIVQMTMGILAVKILTNHLGPEEYGTYGKISEYAIFFSTVANLGIFGNTVRKMSEHPHDGKLFLNALFLRLTSAGIIFLIALIYANSRSEVFMIGVSLFISSMLFDYITSVCDGMLQANYMMGRATLALILGRLINLLVIFLLINLAPITPIFFIAPLTGSLFTSLLSLYFVSQKLDTNLFKLNPRKLNQALDFKEQKEFLLTSLPFEIINIINNLYFRFLPSFFAAKILTNSSYATYNISFHIAAVASMFSTFLMFSVLPQFKHNPKLFNSSAKILGICGFLLITVGSALSPFMIKILTGKEYFLPEYWFVLPMMLILAAVSYFYDLILITLFAHEKEIWLLKREFLALNMAAIFFFIGWQNESIGIIIFGSILGESVITFLGFRKLQSQK